MSAELSKNYAPSIVFTSNIAETTFGWAVITKLVVAVAAYWAVPHFTVAPMTRNQRGWAYVADVGQTFAALLTWMTLLASYRLVLL